MKTRLLGAIATVAFLAACAGGGSSGGGTSSTVPQVHPGQGTTSARHAMAYPQPTGIPTVNPSLHNQLPVGSISAWSFPSGGELQGITVGPDNNLWFTDLSYSLISSISTTGVFGAPYSTPTQPSSPVGIATGADGRLWFTEIGGAQVGASTLTGTMNEWNTLFCAPSSGPLGITQGPDGNIWIADPRANVIEQVKPNGSIKEFSVTGSPAYIATGPDGNLWYTEYTGGKIAKMNTSGTVLAEYQFPTASGGPLQGPLSITAGPDGNMWFAEWPDQVGAYGGTFTRSTGYVYSITMSGTITRANWTGWPLGVGQITTGPDGHLWWANWGNGSSYPSSVYSYNPTTKTFPWTGVLGSRVEYITAGPDGNMWVVDALGSAIYRIGTGV